jgi:heme-degrading monooxygenase HmoA
MLVVWNRIQVNEGFEERFERRQEQAERERIPGRLFFAVLKSDDARVYVNMSVWESRNAFQDWRGSDAFKRAHQGGMEGAVAGPPQLNIAEVIYGEGSVPAP